MAGAAFSAASVAPSTRGANLLFRAKCVAGAADHLLINLEWKIRPSIHGQNGKTIKCK